jgi:hypothetical protein
VDSANQSPEHPAELAQGSSLLDDYSTPLLEALFTGPDRRHQSTGSLVVGILGVIVLAIASAAMAGLCLSWAKRSEVFNNVHPVLNISCVLVLAAMVYPTAILTLQLIASLNWPMTLRLLLVYATLYACLRAIATGIRIPVDAETLLFCAPICGGGFLQHWLRGWNATGWAQQPRPAGKITIASLLDLTAAFAVTMGIASTVRINPQGLPCLLPTFLLLGVLGMHSWARLLSLSNEKLDRDAGLAMWMVGNAMWGSGVFLLIAIAGSQWTVTAVLAFVIPPLVILVAHYFSAIPIAWLRACGWKFVRVSNPAATAARSQTPTFSSSI